jgi:uncharacterized membrane protein (DUF4010 family)
LNSSWFSPIEAVMESLEPLVLFRQLGISLLLGLLVGLQRERTGSEMAGFRTFPLITVLGTLAAVLSKALGDPWILAAGFLGIIGLIVIGNLPKIVQKQPDLGVTTEVAMLVMYAVGAFVVVGPWIIAAAVTGSVAILLQFKPQMHGFAAKIGEQDFRAILQFVLITFIILPVLPNKSYDPLKWLAPLFPGKEFADLAVLNPHQVWLMVVLVVAISLGGYVSYKLLGSQAGAVLGGAIGGLISSTATTVSYARRTVGAPDAAGLAAVAIVIAGTITYVRVLLEILVTAPQFLRQAGAPILILLVSSIALAGGGWLVYRRDGDAMPPQENPTQLKPAIIFGALYAAVLLAVAAGRQFLPSEWLYAIAALSGMTDMDAITLSTSNMVRSGRLAPELGWRLIVVAVMSNLVFKALIVAVVGHRSLLKKIAVLFMLALAPGVAVLLFWR